MIAFIKGRLIEKIPGRAIIDVAGVGYQVNIPFSTFYKLANIGEEVRLHTVYRHTEETANLYGFATLEEKGMFEMVISISGIGPQTGLGILSKISVEDLKIAISKADANTLTKVHGIGSKTAQRIIIELKDKIGEVFAVKKEEERTLDIDKAVFDDAVMALVSLGYSKSQSVNSVDRIRKTMKTGERINIEEIIRRSLQNV